MISQSWFRGDFWGPDILQAKLKNQPVRRQFEHNQAKSFFGIYKVVYK